MDLWIQWGKEQGGRIESAETYILSNVNQKASRKLLCNTGSSTQCSVTTYRGGRKLQEGEDICTLMADLHCCMAETWGFPGGSAVKNPPAKQETWTEEPGDPQSVGVQSRT